MTHHQPFQVVGFHSCDKKVGLQVLNAATELKPSDNDWDWLGPGIYFWEHDPIRAIQYARESMMGSQFNKIPIQVPFVLGALIELGSCLNLVDPRSVPILQEAYNYLVRICAASKLQLPTNTGSNRALDCAVLKYVHQIRKAESVSAFDTVRCPFIEGPEIYPGSSFSLRGHIQLCVRNDRLIRAYFMPRPIKLYNPYL